MGQGSSRLGESGTEPAQEAACSSIRDLRRGQSSVLPGKLKAPVTYAGNFPSHSGQCMLSVAVVVVLSQDLSRLLVSLRSPADDGSLCLT